MNPSFIEWPTGNLKDDQLVKNSTRNAIASLEKLESESWLIQGCDIRGGPTGVYALDQMLKGELFVELVIILSMNR